MGLKHVAFRGDARLVILGTNRELCVLYNCCVSILSHRGAAMGQVLKADTQTAFLNNDDDDNNNKA
jgi:hypothetical protein